MHISSKSNKRHLRITICAESNISSKMTKIYKKLTVKEKKTPIKIKKLKKQYNIKEFSIKLNRMDPSLVKNHRHHSIEVSIQKNVLNIGTKKLLLSKGTAQSINIGLNLKSSNIVTYCTLNEIKQSMAINVPLKTTVKSLNQLIDIEWRSTKYANRDEIQLNQIVLAKMRGYSPWPGSVQGFTKNKKRAHLYFFGTNNTGSVDVAEIVHFEKSIEVVRLLLLRPLNGFLKAVLEAERILGIDERLSITQYLNQSSIETI